MIVFAKMFRWIRPTAVDFTTCTRLDQASGSPPVNPVVVDLKKYHEYFRL